MKTLNLHGFYMLLLPRRWAATAIIIFLLPTQLFAQEAIQFSQYFSNQLILNPAYAGADNALSLTMVHRNQWSGVSGAPKTTTLSGHTLFKNEHTGIGLNFFMDKINIHSNMSASGVYSYRIKTGAKSYLSLGLQGGLYYVKSDYSSLQGTVQIDDPGIGYENLSASAFQFGTGLYFKSPVFELGLSAPVLYSTGIGYLSDESDVLGTTPHYFLYTRYKVHLSPNLQVNPGILIKSNPGWPLSYDFNVDAWIREVLMVALSYRSFETLASIVQVKILPQMRFGYAFDFPLSNTQRRNFNSHEIMLNYIFHYKDYQVKSPR